MQTEQLSFREKFGYGLGDAASNFFFQVFNLFLLFYYTDIFGLAPAAVGTMFLVTKVIDAVSDPVMGMVADRTRSRWGRFRPYLLWMAIPYGLCGWAMFANPDLSDSGKLIYAYVTYTLMMLAYTAINVPYSALMGVISPSSIERTKVSSFRFICAFAAGWLIATFVTPLKTLLGGGDEALGFQITMGIFACISIALFWITFATTKERVDPPPTDSNIKQDLGALLQNGPWLILFASAVLTLMFIAIRSGATIYYFKYFVGDDGTPIFLIFDKTAVFMSTGLIFMLLGLAFTKTLAERFEKKHLMIALSLINAAGMAAFFFIPPEQYALMLVINCIASLANGPTPALVWSMYADVADYGAWKTGRRTTGLVFSATQFAQKMGLAIGGALAGYILALYGFVANQIQSPEALNGILLMFSLIPAALATLGAVAIFFYPLSNAQVAEVERALAGQGA